MAGSRLVIPNADPVFQTPGVPSVGATLTIYNTGTTDLADIYTDQALGTPMSNPLVADGNGLFYEQSTTIWIDDSIAVDAVLTTPAGQNWSYDELTGIPPVQSAGGFAPINSPAFTGNPTAPTPPINDNSNSLATTSFVVSYVQSVLSSFRVIPPGLITPFGTQAIPSGFLVCDGTPVSRTTFANLFAVIGTTFGIGDGTTTFNLPNLLGYFVRGLDTAGSIDPGRALGSIQGDQLGAHTHDVPLGPQDHGNDKAADGTGNGVNLPTSSVGGNETRPKNMALVFAIKT